MKIIDQLEHEKCSFDRSKRRWSRFTWKSRCFRSVWLGV